MDEEEETEEEGNLRLMEEMEEVKPVEVWRGRSRSLLIQLL